MLAIVAGLEALALVALAGAGVWRERQHDRQLQELLNRLMSRNFQDYASSKRVELQAPRRRSMTDADEARLEEKRRQGAAGV